MKVFKYNGYRRSHLALILICILNLFIFNSCANKEPEVIKIGAVLPLSGAAAVWGENTKEGIDLAVEQINEQGGVNGKKIKIIYEDSQALPKQGVSSIQKLINIHNVPAIIDNSVSSVTLAMAPIAQENHVVVLSVGATAPNISEAGEYIFRIWNSDAYEGKVTAQYVYDRQGARKVGILYVNNDYGIGLKEVFTNEFQKRNGEVMITESFDQGATDFRTQLSKLKQKNPPVIYLVGYPQEIPKLLVQSKELGIKAQFFGTVVFNDPQLINAAGDAANGIIFAFPVEPKGKEVEKFRESFRKRYGKDPGATCDTGYDAANMIALAIKLSEGYRGEDIQRGLMIIKNYQGASGIMEFDENGDVHKPMSMKVIRNGKFVWYEK